MDPAAQNNVAQHFRSLHIPGDPLILANVYDAATAKAIIANPHAKAVATASYAIAATYGVEDDDMTLEQNIAAIGKIAAVIVPSGLPLTVDLQDGYDDVAETVQAAIQLGAVGCNLEDVDYKVGKLRSLNDAVGRIKLAVEAARKAGVPQFAINARTDVLGYGGEVEDGFVRGKAYLEAGANTVFVWGGPKGRGVSSEEVKKLVEAFEGKLNVKLNVRPGFATVRELRELGVARISVGPELFLKAMGAYREEASRLLGA